MDTGNRLTAVRGERRWGDSMKEGEGIKQKIIHKIIARGNRGKGVGEGGQKRENGDGKDFACSNGCAMGCADGALLICTPETCMILES